MVHKIKKFLKVFYDAGYHTVHDDGIEHAGYLSFLALLAIFPALIFLLALASNLGNQSYGMEFINQLYGIMPASISEILSPKIAEILSGPPQGILTIAIIGMLWTSSGAVEGIRTILNRVYHVTNTPHFLLRRALSVLQFIVLIFIVLIAMFFLTLAPVILDIRFAVRHCAFIYCSAQH
jgi:membrane protein